MNGRLMRVGKALRKKCDDCIRLSKNRQPLKLRYRHSGKSRGPRDTSMTENEEPYLRRPHVWEMWEKLYWGLLRHTEEHPDREGKLANLSPIEIYNYVAACLSSL